MSTTDTAQPQPRLLGEGLRRSSGDRVLLGLCGGIAEATGSSALAIRLGTWALAMVILPVVLLAYLVTAVILPRDDGTTLIGPGARENRDVVTAVVTTLVAAPVVLGATNGTVFTGGHLWGMVWISIVLLGIALALRHHDRRTAGAPTWSPASPTGSASAAPAPAAPPSDPFAGTTTGPYPDAGPETAATVVGATDETLVRRHAPGSPARPSFVKAAAVAGPEAPTFVRPGTPGASGASGDEHRRGDGDGHGTGGAGGGPGAGGPGDGQPPAPHTPPPAPAPRRRGLGLPVLAIVTLIPAVFAVLVAVGLIDSGTTAWAVMLALMAVASAAGAVAIALLRPSYLGAGFLVILAAFFGAASIGVNQVGPVLDDGLGERTFRPTASDELRRPYLLGAGELTVDLRDLELARGSRTRIDAKLGFGHLRFIVPPGVRVIASPTSEVPALTASARRTGNASTTVAAAPTIELDVDVRGAQVDLLTGNATRIENLEVLQSYSTGFWGSDDNSGEAAGAGDRGRSGAGSTP